MLSLSLTEKKLFLIHKSATHELPRIEEHLTVSIFPYVCLQAKLYFKLKNKEMLLIQG